MSAKKKAVAEAPEPPCCPHPQCIAEVGTEGEFCPRHSRIDRTAERMAESLRRALGEVLADTDWRSLPLAVQLRVAAEVAR